MEGEGQLRIISRSIFFLFFLLKLVSPKRLVDGPHGCFSEAHTHRRVTRLRLFIGFIDSCFIEFV